MINLAQGVIVTILAVLYCAWWWYIAKGAPYRIYILLLGLCFLVIGASVLIGESLNLPFLGLVAVIGFVLAAYFYIRAALSAHRAKKKISDE